MSVFPNTFLKIWLEAKLDSFPKKVEAALADFTMATFHNQKNPSGYYHR